uniref:Cytochrome P450 n=1 Tax=Nothapodytes nimmoniana TaxID=159386 RepID=A0A7L7RB47_NOTNI|nr:cytochrome P450 [Nothapodytes nimmoniana]
MGFFLDTTLVGVFAFILFIYFLSWRTRAKGLPPEAGGAWPLIGHLHLLGGRSKLPHIALGELADKYGPVFTIRLGKHRVLVVSSWEVAKELFTKYDVSVSSRPDFVAARVLGYDGAMFGLSPYGPYWRELRKIVSMELLSGRRLELIKHIRVSELESSMKELYDLWSKRESSSGHVLVEMKQWFGDLTLNVIFRMVAGKRYFGGAASGDEEEAAWQCQKVMRDFMYFLGVNVLADAVPLLGWLDWGGNEKAMKRTAKEMEELVCGWLEEHHRKRNSAMAMDAPSNDQDFMDVMLSAASGSEFTGFDADTVVKATCLSLIAGGSDTTTVMLTWALSLLMNNPNALQKAQEELDVHVGKEKRVNESDINNLVYLQAIIKETLRMYPVAPLLTPREFIEDCNIRSYNIPKGTRLCLNLSKLQRDPNVWSDPLEFKPERFLTSHKDVDVKGHHFELLPFGAGRRICPGIGLGLQMMHLVLATVLHGFELSTPNNALVDMTESSGLTNAKLTPLEVLIAPRLSCNLY